MDERSEGQVLVGEYLAERVRGKLGTMLDILERIIEDEGTPASVKVQALGRWKELVLDKVQGNRKAVERDEQAQGLKKALEGVAARQREKEVAAMASGKMVPLRCRVKGREEPKLNAMQMAINAMVAKSREVRGDALDFDEF